MPDPAVCRAVAELAPWFHNLHLPDGTRTAPGHPLGDFPAFKWRALAPHLPADLSGWRALDIGCNAGFYSFELARRGARVTGIDVDDHYLRQARWAGGQYGLDVTFRRAGVYDLAGGDEGWDLILFMGVFYHLRYPLLALDILADLAPRLMVFQTLTMGGREVAPGVQEDVDYRSRARFDDPGWPKMAFIEHTFCHDPTNWWVPNHAAVLAMLRSCGFAVDDTPGQEIYVCRPDPALARHRWDRSGLTLPLHAPKG